MRPSYRHAGTATSRSGIRRSGGHGQGGRLNEKDLISGITWVGALSPGRVRTGAKSLREMLESPRTTTPKSPSQLLYPRLRRLGRKEEAAKVSGNPRGYEVVEIRLPQSPPFLQGPETETGFVQWRGSELDAATRLRIGCRHLYSGERESRGYSKGRDRTLLAGLGFIAAEAELPDEIGGNSG